MPWIIPVVRESWTRRCCPWPQMWCCGAPAPRRGRSWPARRTLCFRWWWPRSATGNGGETPAGHCCATGPAWWCGKSNGSAGDRSARATSPRPKSSNEKEQKPIKIKKIKLKIKINKKFKKKYFDVYRYLHDWFIVQGLHMHKLDSIYWIKCIWYCVT